MQVLEPWQFPQLQKNLCEEVVKLCLYPLKLSKFVPNVLEENTVIRR